MDLATLLPISWQFVHNYHRCKALVAAADERADLGLAGVALAGDLRRAAVVLAHATLEDFIRSLVEIRLPLAEARYLKTVPLLLGEDAARSTQYTLSDLVFYREQPVGEVIRRSVIAYLAGITYNRVDQIALALDQIGLSRSLLANDGKELAAMMARRHHIAHRADRAEDKSGGEPMSRPIESPTVTGWIDAVFRFGDAVTNSLAASSTEGGVG